MTRDRGYLLRVDREHLDAALFQDGFTAGRAALEAGRYAEAAETLRTALDLWRSPVLADLADYAFTRPEAARLEELRLAALEARIDADLALGRHDALTAELEQLAAEHPLRERLHGQLMLALYRCGRQAEALAAYRRARDLLADELGIDPGEPLQRLHASVLAHDPALDWNGGRQAPAEGRTAPASPGDLPRRRDPLVGGRGQPGAGLGAAARPPPAGHRSALAVAAAVCIVVVARPWAGEPAGLPANSVGLIDPAGGRVGAAGHRGQPGRPGLWRRLGLGRGQRRRDAVPDQPGHPCRGTDDPGRLRPGRGDRHRPRRVGRQQRRRDGVADQRRGQRRGADDPGRQCPGRHRQRAQRRVGGQPRRRHRRPDRSGYRRRDQEGVQVGALPDGVAVGPDAVWVANGEDGTVTRIDPATGQPSGPMPVGSGPEGIAVTPAAVWVANSLDLTVSKLDPATGRVTATIGVGDGPGAIAAAKDGVWVSDEFGATLDRIDPRTDQVTASSPWEARRAALR